jgi:hypothetical protein
MHYTRVLDVAGLWQPVADAGAARAAVREALEAFPARSDEREGIVVSRVDARAAPSHQPDRR